MNIKCGRLTNYSVDYVSFTKGEPEEVHTCELKDNSHLCATVGQFK